MLAVLVHPMKTLGGWWLTTLGLVKDKLGILGGSGLLLLLRVASGLVERSRPTEEFESLLVRSRVRLKRS